MYIQCETFVPHIKRLLMSNLLELWALLWWIEIEFRSFSPLSLSHYFIRLRWNRHDTYYIAQIHAQHLTVSRLALWTIVDYIDYSIQWRYQDLEWWKIEFVAKMIYTYPLSKYIWLVGVLANFLFWCRKHSPENKRREQR